MKKLRMIVASVIVLTIVGSAFAFHAKIARWCILTTTDAGDNCTTALDSPLRLTTGSGVRYKYYPPSFDGDKTACSTTNNHHCTATAIFTLD